MDSWIHRYSGEWQNSEGNRLLIETAGCAVARVDFLGPTGEAIARPWCNGMPSVGMAGSYEKGRGLIVELWEKGKGFTLEVSYDPEYLLLTGPVEALTIGVSRYESDHYLAQYVELFGSLTHFTRTNNGRPLHSGIPGSR